MINIFEPSVGDESLKLLESVFKSKWLGRGEVVNKFEQALCEYLQIPRGKFHTIASCTDAIFASLVVFDLPKNSKVIIPSNSFPAIPSAILEAGLEPVIVDVQKETGNICLDALQDYFDSDCSAVFVTDYGGIPNDLMKIRDIIGKDAFLFLDAAASMGTFVNNIFSGKEADFCCWSFDAMKLLTCGEGGGVYIDDSRIMERFREYTYLGLPASAKSGIDRSKDNGLWWEYQLSLPGRRSVFTNINASIGLPQIKTLEHKIVRKTNIREAYIAGLKNIGGLALLEQNSEYVRYSNYFFTVLCESRDGLAQYLKENGVYTTFRYYPTHRINLFERYAAECPNTDYFSDNALNLPIHDSLVDADVTKIISLVNGFFTAMGRQG